MSTKNDRKLLIHFLLAVLLGCASTVTVLILFSQGAQARLVLQSASLSLSKVESADPVQVGSHLVYTLTYENTGTETVTAAVITDTLDPNVQFVSAEPEPDGGLPNAPYWSLGTLTGTVSGTIVLTVSVPITLPNGLLLTNTATIGSDQTDPLSTQITTTVAAPVLALSKQDAPDPVIAGATLIYTLTYTNSGDAPAGDAVVTDVLDSRVIFVAASPAPAGGEGQTRYWHLGSLPPSSSGDVIVTVTVQSGLEEGTVLTNTAFIDSQETAPLSTVQTTTVTAHGDPVLITLSPSTASLNAGLSITYTLTAQDAYGNGWDVTDSGAYTITPAAGGSWTANVYTAQVAGSWTVTATLGALADTATLTVTHADPTAVSLSPPTASLNAGLSITYTLTAQDAYGNGWDVTDSGAYTITPAAGGSWTANVYTAQVAGSWTVTGSLDALFDIATLTVRPGELDHIVLSPISATIQAGSVQTYTVEAFDAFGNSRGDVTAGTSFSIIEPGHGGSWDGNVYTSRNPGNWTVHSEYQEKTDNASLTVLAPVLHLLKTGEPGLVEAGAYLTYTLAYSNTGNQTATGLALTDTLDSNTVYASAVPSPTGFIAGNPYWHLNPLAPQESGQVLLRVHVEKPLPNGTLLTNNAILGCDQTGPVTATEQTTVHSQPVLTLIKKDGPDPVEAGAVLVYTLTYTNTGNEVATGVLITDVLDPHINFVSANPPAQGMGDVRYWTFPTLPLDTPGQIIITTTVDRPLPNGTLLTNTAWLDTDQTTPISTTQVTTAHSRPVLSITKDDWPDPVQADGILQYTIVFTNTGNENATGVTVVEDYDPNVSFISANPAPAPGTDNEWHFSLLEVDHSRTIEVLVRVHTPLPVGTVLTNVVTLDTDQTSPISVTETTQALSETDLDVNQTDVPDPVQAGGQLAYAIVCENNGSAPATNVILTDTYDSRVNFLSANPPPSAGNNVWYLGTLNAGQSRTILVQVSVDSPLPNGTFLINTVTVSSNESPPASFTEPTQVSSSPQVAFSLVDRPDPVEAGAQLTYTLRYTNTGNADATGVLITATLDSHLNFLSATPPPTNGGGRTWYWNVDTIPGEGGTGQITIRTGVELPLPNGTMLTTTARLSYAEGAALQAAEGTTVHSAPILSFSKSDGTSTVEAGQTLTYTLVATNSGNENAYSLVITDTLPNYIQYLGCSISPGSCSLISGGRVVYSIPILVAQTSVQARLTVRVLDPLPAGARTVINRAVMNGPALSSPIEVEDVDAITTRPDLTLSVVHTPSLFSPGKPMTYTITYSNAGRMDAENVWIQARLPLSTTYVGYNWNPAGGRTYSYTVGNLPAGSAGLTVQLVISYAADPQIGALTVSTPFSITGSGGLSEDANPTNNSVYLSIGVPDLVVTDFTFEPRPLVPNRPVTFTVVVENQGAGIAWNPDNLGGFWLDLFTAPVLSYPWDGWGFTYAGVNPIPPGESQIITIHHAGFSEQQIASIEAFYAKVDNHQRMNSQGQPEALQYGLVPERNEYNNVSLPLDPMAGDHTIYLPLILRSAR